jgi:hypothetical protein
MGFNCARIEPLAEAYGETEPLYGVETDHLETLPAALADGEYGWRDVVWVVRWHYRRYLGAYPDADRRDAEAAFERNDFEDVRAAIGDAVDAETPRNALESLRSLRGVDVPVASAILFFLDPGAYIVVGEREWTALEATGELSASYPDPPTANDYERYLGACETVAERCECDLRTLYRALWRHSNSD